MEPAKKMGKTPFGIDIFSQRFSYSGSRVLLLGIIYWNNLIDRVKRKPTEAQEIASAGFFNF